LFNAPADLLVAWHTAALAAAAEEWAAMRRRLGAGVGQVYRARLDGDVDALDRACHRLIDIACGEWLVAVVRAAVADLAQALVAADPVPCLVDCATCTTARTSRT
jgi:hypothetical protein